MFFKLLLFAQFIFLFSSFSLTLKALDCPPGYSTWEYKTTDIIPTYTGMQDKMGTVGYNLSANAPNYDVKIDWNSLNNQPVGYYQVYNLTNEELKDFVVPAVIWNLIASNRANGNFTVSFYEEAPCTIKHYCYFKTVGEYSEKCSDPEFTDRPVQYTKLSEYYIRRAWKEDCGTKCCKATYFCTTTGYDSFTINSVTKTDYSPCSGTSTPDCFYQNDPTDPNYLEKCEGNCP